GSHFAVAVAALTDVLNVETLTTIPLHVHGTNITGALDAGERFVCALRTALRSLHHNFYETANNLPQRQIEYPFRDYILQNSERMSFEYKEQVDDKRVFRGSLKDGNSPLFIKFSRRYGEATHRRAQEVGLAPQLLSVEQIHGWYIVAMEDLSQSYETLHDVLYNGHDVDPARHSFCPTSRLQSTSCML
ncbi:hypothetical protein BT96DRAFT_831172, partial [Gymnopus androsaceus JB14]